MSGELVRNGVLAVVLAILGIALFAVFRFEWQFGVSTVVAIVHDLLMTLGFFAITQMDFDLNIVAAVLTIIGYSINDKIVIDDRIRENMRKYRKMDMREIVDLSVNETLPRTVMTSLTILLALFALAVPGRPRAARVHQRDDPGHHRRHLFVDLRVVVAADHARPARQSRGRGAQGRQAPQRRGRAAVKIDPVASGPGPMIQGFVGTGFRVDGETYPALLLTAEAAQAWSPPPLADLSEADLAPLLAAEPEFVILGTGATLVRPPKPLRDAFAARNLGLEAMDSRAAARAWTVLRAEGRRVAAALYPLT